MLKFTSNNDFNFEVESVSLVTSSSQLTKRASARSLLQFEKNAKQEDLHVIALGAYEGTGYNRNGDAFMEADCKKNHHYFKRADRAVHRHHKNKPADPKFGNIKAAAYNDAMKRIELIIGLDKDACADILHEQEKTGNTNWSMASKQAYDVCSWCGHKAKTDKDRCEHIPRNIGDLNKTGEMCGMINPDPRWFEISYVRRPADRIGLSLGKVASAGEWGIKPMLPSDFLNIYGDVYVPDELLISKKACDKNQLIVKLAALEKRLDAVAKKPAGEDRALKLTADKWANDDLPASVMDELRKHDPSKILKMLADHGIVFSPSDFIKYIFGNRADRKADGMKSWLPDVFSRLNDGDSKASVSNNEKYEPGCSTVGSLKSMMQKLTDGFSLKGGPVRGRIMSITIIGRPSEPMKAADEVGKTKEAFDKELANQYAAYKLAALNYLDEQGALDDELLVNALVQNRK